METEDEQSRPVRGAFAYPFAGEGSRTRLLAGAGLNLLAGVLFLGVLFVGRTVAETFGVATVGLVVALVGLLAYVPLAGYGVAAARAVLDGEESPPAFDPAAVVRGGLWSVGLAILFALPLVALTVLSLAGETVADGVAAAAATYGAAAAALAYGLLAAYALPAAVVNATHEESVRAALSTDLLRETLYDRAYLGPWLAAAAVVLAGTLLGVVLAVVVVGFAVLFAAQLAAVNLVTHGVVAARDITTSDEPPAPPASGHVPGWSEQQRRRRLSGGSGPLPTTAAEGDDPAGDAGEADRAAAALEGGTERTTAGGGDDAARTGAAGTDLAPVGGDESDDSEDEDIEPYD